MCVASAYRVLLQKNEISKIIIPNIGQPKLDSPFGDLTSVEASIKGSKNITQFSSTQGGEKCRGKRLHGQIREGIV